MLRLGTFCRYLRYHRRIHSLLILLLSMLLLLLLLLLCGVAVSVCRWKSSGQLCKQSGGCHQEKRFRGYVVYSCSTPPKDVSPSVRWIHMGRKQIQKNTILNLRVLKPPFSFLRLFNLSQHYLWGFLLNRSSVSINRKQCSKVSCSRLDSSASRELSFMNRVYLCLDHRQQFWNSIRDFCKGQALLRTVPEKRWLLFCTASFAKSIVAFFLRISGGQILPRIGKLEVVELLMQPLMNSIVIFRILSSFIVGEF